MVAAAAVAAVVVMVLVAAVVAVATKAAAAWTLSLISSVLWRCLGWRHYGASCGKVCSVDLKEF